jgi:hypothetical protein
MNKMTEIMGEFVKSTLYKEDTNPDEWFAELFYLYRRL